MDSGAEILALLASMPSPPEYIAMATSGAGEFFVTIAAVLGSILAAQVLRR